MNTAVDVSIRAELPGDRESISKIHQLAFQRTDEGELVDRIRDGDTFFADLSLVATVDEQIVGHILFSLVHIDTADGMKPVLALAPLAVHPDYQKSGVGSKLTRYGLALAREVGWQGVIVLGQPSYYTKFGFKPAYEFGIESPFPLNDPAAFMVLELQQDALQGCMGTVIYPDAFISRA